MNNFTPDCVVFSTKSGLTVIVDSADGDLATYRWLVREYRYAYLRVERTATVDAKKVHFILGRVILERVLDRSLSRKEQVDHRDRNPLNNSRSNLRLATPQQNLMNKGKQRNNKSGYKGVHFDNRDKKWRASIGFDGKRISLGSFGDPESAYAAYCQAAKELFGAFVCLD